MDKLRLLSTRAVSRLCRLVSVVVANVHDARVCIVGTDINQSCRVAVVGVDANDGATIVGSGALDVDIALALIVTLR